MKKTLLYFLFLAVFNSLSAQDTLRPTQLLITDPQTKKKVALEITELNCQVEVTGNRVQTTYYLTFYNPNDRDMEGILEFPLGENENVVRFALEVNGNLREGVVVDKAKGQKVFEEIENRRVDPGLIEKTIGNNYRARVYPVPAKGSKRLAIGCERIIRPMKDEDILIAVPLVYNQIIKQFDLKVTVYNESNVPVPEKNELVNISFEKWNNAYTASKSIQNFDARTTLRFTIPKKGTGEQILIEKNKDGKYVFAVSVFPEFSAQQKLKAKSPCIIWDASYSGTGRDKVKEINFVKAYLKKMGSGTMKAQAVYFNLKKEKSFSVSNGESAELIAWLNGLVFDGATRLDNFDLSPKGCDEVLFFSDGLGTIGKTSFKTGKAIVIPVVSSPSNDFYVLKNLAQQTGGKYIDLNVLTADKAIETASSKPYRYIGLKNNSGVEEVYGDLTLESGKSFTLTGLTTSLPLTLEMEFGIGDSVLSHHKVKLDESQLTVIESGMERIWALQKLNALELLPQENKKSIIAHSTEWAVVSPYTSLIVLETLQDYIQYEVVPPEELRKDYFAHMESVRKQEESTKQDRLNQVNSMYQAKLEWYNMGYDDTIRVVIQENKIKAKIKELQNQLDTLRRTQNHYRRIVDSLGVEISKVDEELLYMKWRLDSLHAPELHLVAYPRADRYENELMQKEMMLLEANKMMSDSYASASHSAMRDELVRANDVNAINNNERNFERNRAEEITIKEWDPQTPYMKALKVVADAQLYTKYIELREDYLTSASFYLDVAEYFIKKNKKEEAILILSNLAEMKNEDCPFIRILATRYAQINENDYAVDLFKRALELRPYEPQSYRDLGLALAKSKKYQEAVDTLYQVALRVWDSRFPEIENIVLTEMNSIIATCGKKLDVSKMDERLLKDMPSDIRVVLTWDSDQVDIDLHTTDPNNEECSYSNKRTRIGGRNSNDFTGGYGPEEFMAHYGMDGVYKMKIKYYGERSVTLLGPTTIMIQVFTNYGRPNQKVQEFTRRLETTGEWLEVGEVKFGK